MKNLLFPIAFICIFSFCRNNKNTNKITKKEPIFKLSEHYSKFKFHDLKEFKLDGYWHGKGNERHYQKLDSVMAFKIFQQDDSLSPYDAHFYYSTFSDPTLIAIVEESEGNGMLIWLCKFDKKGQFIDKEIIANHLIDGGEFWRSYGQFIGNNTFIHTEIDSWDFEENETIDSSIVKIKFEQDNSIKIDTLFKNTRLIPKNK